MFISTYYYQRLTSISSIVDVVVVVAVLLECFAVPADVVVVVCRFAMDIGCFRASDQHFAAAAAANANAVVGVPAVSSCPVADNGAR